MPSNGEMVPVPATAALPPPPLRVLRPALSLITAMLFTDAPSSGNACPWLRSSTVPASATSRAKATCSSVEATASGVSLLGWSTRPNRNSSVRIRDTMSSTRLCATVPADTAAFSRLSNQVLPGISMSIPALAEPTVL